MAKEIKLNHGKVAIVDDEDYEYLNQFKWYCTSYGYARRTVNLGNGKFTKIFMHREIMNTPKGMITDHIDMNKLNNQKSNLRICTYQENQRNRPRLSNSKHKYKGTYYYKKDKLWGAHIGLNNKTIKIGFYKTEIEAALAYNEMAKKLFGEFAQLNEIEMEEGVERGEN